MVSRRRAARDALALHADVPVRAVHVPNTHAQLRSAVEGTAHEGIGAPGVALTVGYAAEPSLARLAGLALSVAGTRSQAVAPQAGRGEGGAVVVVVALAGARATPADLRWRAAGVRAAAPAPISASGAAAVVDLLTHVHGTARVFAWRRGLVREAGDAARHAQQQRHPSESSKAWASRQPVDCHRAHCSLPPRGPRLAPGLQGVRSRSPPSYSSRLGDPRPVYTSTCPAVWLEACGQYDESA